MHNDSVDNSNNAVQTSSKVEIGQVIRTSVSSDSVFLRTEEVPNVQTQESTLTEGTVQTQESTVESPVADAPTQENSPLTDFPARESNSNSQTTDIVARISASVNETQNQESTIESQEAKSNEEPETTVNQEKNSPGEQVAEHQEQVEEKVSDESTTVDTVAPAEDRLPSSRSGNEIEECNSVSKLPKVIVRKSINAALKRVSLQKGTEIEEDLKITELNSTENEAHDGQVNRSIEQANQDETDKSGKAQQEQETESPLPLLSYQSDGDQPDVQDKDVRLKTPPNSIVDEAEYGDQTAIGNSVNNEVAGLNDNTTEDVNTADNITTTISSEKIDSDAIELGVAPTSSNGEDTPQNQDE